MSTFYKCDKCGKVIKENEKNLHFLSMNSTFSAELRILSDSICVCEKCSEPFIKYLKNFLNIKKTNK